MRSKIFVYSLKLVSSTSYGSILSCQALPDTVYNLKERLFDISSLIIIVYSVTTRCIVCHLGTIPLADNFICVSNLLIVLSALQLVKWLLDLQNNCFQRDAWSCSLIWHRQGVLDGIVSDASSHVKPGWVGNRRFSVLWEDTPQND